MKKNVKEQINDLVVRMKELSSEINKCISELEQMLQAKEEKPSINDTNEFFYQQCKIKDICTTKNCAECIYRNDGKKYYIGGQ